MTVLVVLLALLFWACVFLIFLTSQGTTPSEFLFGRFDPPPADLGTWKQTEVDDGTGRVREERLLLPGNNPKARRFLHQVRYRDPVTRDITCVEPERWVRRRRSKTR